MKISVKVKPNAKQEKIEKLSDNSYSVSVKAKPQDGKANYAVREVLAEHFAIPKSRIILITGETSRNKIYEVFL